LTDDLTIPPAVATADTTEKHYPVEFKGNGFEFFKIWIVNVLLTIVTLSIYAPWAKVRTKRYFYGNTVIDNSSFEYHATGKQIFLGRLVAVAALIAINLIQYIHLFAAIAASVVIFLLLPWVIWRSLKFNARMSSYRNVRFGFSGTASRIYYIALLLPILILVVGGALVVGSHKLLPTGASVIVTTIAVIAAYALYPIFHQLFAHYSHNFHRYGTSMFAAPLRKRSFCWMYFKAFLPFVLLFFVIGLIAALMKDSPMLDFASAIEDPEDLDELLNSPMMAAASVGIYGTIFIIGSLITAYFRSMIRNYRYNLTTIGDRVKLHSAVKTFPLWGLTVTNFLLLIFTVGLAYPWVKVRSAKFFARHTEISSKGPLDAFASDEQDKVTSIGAELGEAFDLDLDIGI